MAKIRENFNAFDFDASKYKTAAADTIKRSQGIVSQIELSGKEAILDLGCGNGEVTRQLALRVPDGHILGIDASEKMIKEAQKTPMSNVEYLLMDINKMNFTNQYDVIFSTATLHWIQNHDLLLNNVIKALRTGGYIRFEFPAKGNFSVFFSSVKLLIRTSRWKDYFSDFNWPWYMPSVSAYKKTLSSIPLKNIRVWAESGQKEFLDTAAIHKWVSPPCFITVPFEHMLKKEERTSFVNDLARQMTAKLSFRNGRYIETTRRLNVYAQKA